MHMFSHLCSILLFWTYILSVYWMPSLADPYAMKPSH